MSCYVLRVQHDLLATLSLGLFLGMRHATDADHVVAVTTVVSRERTRRAAALIGAVWGMGHTTTILVVGGAIVVFGLIIPPRLGLSLEMCVAVMLVLLGALNLSGAWRRVHAAAHGHPPTIGDGSTAADPSRRGVRRVAQSFAVGLVHGLAGSAAVALLVLATIQSPGWAALYLAVFGFGTVLGMMALTTLMAMPMLLATKRFGALDRSMARITGAISVCFGLFLAYRIGITDGLFFGHVTWVPE